MTTHDAPQQTKIRSTEPVALQNRTDRHAAAGMADDSIQMRKLAAMGEQANREPVAQLVKFKRFSGWRRAFNWISSSQEDEIRRQEKRVRKFVEEMKPYQQLPAGHGVGRIEATLAGIEHSVIDEGDYKEKLNVLKSLYDQLERLSNAIASDHNALLSRYNGLPADQAWRESVDLKHQKFGPKVYDTGVHHTPPRPEYIEPGAADSIATARAHVMAALGTPLTVEKYRQINEFATPPKISSSWRSESHNEIEIGVAKNTFKDQRRNMKMTLDMQSASRIDGDRRGRAEMSVSTFPGDVADTHRIALMRRPTAEVQAMVADILQTYYRKIETAEDRSGRLKIIAETHQLLERLHAFKDANTRTNLLVLNKLLTEQGYHPVILDDPNTSYLVSTEEWVTEIERGLQRWKDLKDGRPSSVPAVQEPGAELQEQEHKSPR